MTRRLRWKHLLVKKEGILNVNEVRKMAGLGDDIEGGEVYQISTNSSPKSDEETIEKIRENLQKMYEGNA